MHDLASRGHTPANPFSWLGRVTAHPLMDDLSERIRDGEVIERPSATFTMQQVLRLYRLEHASRARNPCVPGRLCVACARADELLRSRRILLLPPQTL